MGAGEETGAREVRGARVGGPPERAPGADGAPTSPLALVILLENTGRITGVTLPGAVMRIIDFVAEEYAKFTLRLHGVWRRYDRVLLLEDARATGPALRAALIAASRTHRVDVMILAHGLPYAIVGHRGFLIGPETFGPLLEEYRANPSLLNLRMVWQMNCYGVTLSVMWRALGATVVNGSAGVNWLPEPSLSVFLRHWMRGASYATSVQRSVARAEQMWRPIYRPQADASPHPRIRTSRPIILGDDIHLMA